VALTVGCLLSALTRSGQSAAVAQETQDKGLAYVMNQIIQEAQRLLGDLALADRQKVQERGEKLAELALRIPELEPPQNTGDMGTFKYLAYSAHVHARQVAEARSPKTAQEKFGQLTADCVDCHHLFRDWVPPERE
jgi:cytochrome c556